MIEQINTVIAGESPVFFMLAGPNGAGKSTYREKRLVPIGLTCIDPDEIAKNLLGRHACTRAEALQATQTATERVRQHFRCGRTICLETVFSDTRGYKLKLLKEARNFGYKTCLIFIGLESVQLCIARVMDRVDQGGHDVPDALIEDRYSKCLVNLKSAIAVADVMILVDNSRLERHYEFCYIESGRICHLKKDPPVWFSAVKKELDKSNP